MSTPVQNTNLFATRFAESVSGALNERAMGYLAIGKEDGNIKAVAKYTAKEIVSAANFAFGSVEAVIRNVLLVVAKTVQFFIPKGYSQTFDSKILNPLRSHAHLNSVNALDAGTKLVTNLLNNKRQSAVENTIVNGMFALYHSNFSNALAKLHINGFTAPTPVKKQVADLAAAKAKRAPKAIAELEKKIAQNKKAAEAKAQAEARAQANQKGFFQRGFEAIRNFQLPSIPANIGFGR